MASGHRYPGDDEQVLLEARLHPLSLVIPLTLLVALAAGAVCVLLAFHHEPHLLRMVLAGVVALALVVALGRFLAWRARRLIVTNERLLVRGGLFGRHGVEIGLRRIVSIRTHQRLIERMVGRGRIEVETTGEGALLSLEEVAHPLKVAKTINTAIDGALGVAVAPSGGPVRAVGEALGRLHSLYRRGLITSTELDERSSELGAGEEP